MRTHFISFFFFLLSLCLVLEASGQKKSRFFQIPGRVKMDKGDSGGVLMSVYNLETNAAEKNENLTASGKFSLQLSYQKEYKISFSKEGCYTKEILISTKVPAAVWKKDSIFPPYNIVVTLFQKINDTRMSFEGKPIGKIGYSPEGKIDNFDSRIYITDKDIKQELDAARKQMNLKKDEFKRLVAEGNGNFEKKNFAEAITRYKEALKMKPDETSLISKISAAENLLAQTIASQTKTEEDFMKFQSLGDEFVSKKMYSESIIVYRNALKIHPQDPGVLNKLSDSEKLLSKSTEENKRLAEGEKNLSKQKYPEAIESFRNVLNREEEFRRFISKGDESSAGKRYPEAIDFYSKALAIRSAAELRGKITGAREAQARMNQPAAPLVQRELSKPNPTESYADQVRSGDENYARSQFAAARFYYVEALKIQPADSYALKKLESCDQQIRGNMTAGKLKSYEELMKKANTAYQDKNYNSARFYYRSALEILPWEQLPAEKLAEIDQLYADKLTSADQRLFRENQQKADQAFQNKDYAVARFYYNKANEINPDEYNHSKLRQIADLISETEKNRKEAEFKDLVNHGNEAFNRKNEAQARYYYTKALEMRPGEEYLREQLKKLSVTK